MDADAAPFATRQLADLGARVIKIEWPGEGDLARADAILRALGYDGGAIARLRSAHAV